MPKKIAKVKTLVRCSSYLLALAFLLTALLVYFLAPAREGPEASNEIGTLFGIGFALLAIILLIQIFAPFFVEGSVFTTAFMAFFLLGMAATSLSALSFYGNFDSSPSPDVLYPIEQFFFFLYLASFFSFQRVYYFPDHGNRSVLAYSFLVVAIPSASYHFGSYYALVGYFLGLLLFLVPAVASIAVLAKKGTDDMTYFLTVLLTAVAGSFGLFEGLQAFFGYRWGLVFELVDLFAIIVCFVSIFFVNYVLVDQRRREERARARHYESEALLFEINPHLIYNGLAAIKGKYRVGKEEGDRLIDSFANYLRGSLAIGRKKLISLKEELGNLSTYIDFISEVTDFQGQVIFDIETEEGEIPPLSLQPFVENVFKHAGINGRKDGLLLISTRLNETAIDVKIIDNGKGFLPDGKNYGEGIRNVIARSELILGEAPLIESVPGKGTELSFRLRRKSHGQNHRRR